MLNLVLDGMSPRECKQEYSGRRLSNAVLFLFCAKLHTFDERPRHFSVICSSDILKQHNIIKGMVHIFRLVLFAQIAQTCPSRMMSSASTLMLPAAINQYCTMVHISILWYSWYYIYRTFFTAENIIPQ